MQAAGHPLSCPPPKPPVACEAPRDRTPLYAEDVLGSGSRLHPRVEELPEREEVPSPAVKRIRPHAARFFLVGAALAGIVVTLFGRAPTPSKNPRNADPPGLMPVAPLREPARPEPAVVLVAPVPASPSVPVSAQAPSAPRTSGHAPARPGASNGANEQNIFHENPF